MKIREQATEKLFLEINKLEDKYISKISSILISSIKKSKNKNSEEIIEIWNKAEKEIIDLIYQMLEKVYAYILKFIKKYYPKAESERMDIKDLIWDKDGKTIEDRVKIYCDFAKEYLTLIGDAKNEELRETLIYNFMRITQTENTTIFHTFLKEKISKHYKYGYISNGKCECCATGGVIKPVADIKWPPRHPLCSCFVILLEEKEN